MTVLEELIDMEREVKGVRKRLDAIDEFIYGKVGSDAKSGRGIIVKPRSADGTGRTGGAAASTG